MKTEKNESWREISDGIWKSNRSLYTESYAPGIRVYGEHILRKGAKEFREWEPSRSKLAAAIANGLRKIPVKKGSIMLYLGSSTGTTVSHISDIIGESGAVYSVEFSERVFREFLRVAGARDNIIPLLSDARKPSAYGWIEECQVMLCDLAQSDQTEIAIRNAMQFLAKGGFIMLSVKSQSIDISKNPDQIYKEAAEKLVKGGFEILETINLEPHEQKHALILAKKN